MPRKTAPAPHPAYALMLAESAATGLPRSFQRDLTEHDRLWLEARDPKLSFLWALRPDGTHTVGLEPDRGTGRASVVKIFDLLARGWEDCRFYLWNGVSLQGFATTEAARAGMLDLIEREAEHAREIAARFCQSNPSTPHEWRNGKCDFCEVSQPKPHFDGGGPASL